MTIQERAHKTYPIKHSENLDYIVCARYGFIKGATEQRDIDTEKSIIWLEKYMESLGYIDEWCRKGEEEFRKMMEEDR